MITVAGTPPQKRQKGGVFRHRESIKGNYNEISLVKPFNVIWNGKHINIKYLVGVRRSSVGCSIVQ